ncbi:MAG: sigma-54-dependent Fis family transcriptional regulator, partial [Calditrichaeota bacterium]|nr:sigma-54-dependent Fis family transcriptional regulator [Calditrichota bacterium]
LKAVKKKLRRAAVAELDRAFIKEALQRSGGNVTQAAREVGMQRRNFQTMMKQYGIKGEG